MWTGDTSMALCLAESLIECKAFDPEDQMCRYVRWYQEGHLSSNGYLLRHRQHNGRSARKIYRDGTGIRRRN